jgi:hypothetical protein
MAIVERFILTKDRRLLEVEIGQDGRIDIVACCLKTDSWEDFLVFKAEAKDASARADKKSL